MLSTCPPRVTGVALVVSSCPTTRCCWCCAGGLKLSDDQVLLVLRWSSQAVRRPGVAGVALAVSSCPTTRYCGTTVSVSYCLTVRYYWCCAGRLKLSDDQVLLMLRWPSQAVRRPGVIDVALAVSSCPTTSYCGTTVSVSYCLTVRYYWCCAGRLKLSDDQLLRYYCVRLLLLDGPVLPVLRWPSQAVRRPVTAVLLCPSPTT